MAASAPDLGIAHPISTPPGPGQIAEVAPGIGWARLPLPFRLDHVNVYFVDDGAGVAAIDTGIDSPECRAAWERLLAGPLAGRPLTRLIVTHCHPDHIGLANWLAERTGLVVETTEAEYLTALVIHLDPEALEAEHFRDFYRSRGLDEDTTRSVMSRGHRYLRMVAGLPRTFRRVIAGETLTVGGSEFRVMTGGGHSPEQMFLHGINQKIFLSADQVLPRISPNIGVGPRDPGGDPLGIFLRSLRAIRDAVPDDVLVLPGHDLPFRGLHARIEGLIRHHAERCDAIVSACRADPHSPADLIPVLFHRVLDPHGTGFAFGETVAHVNYLLRRGRLRELPPRDGVMRLAA